MKFGSYLRDEGGSHIMTYKEKRDTLNLILAWLTGVLIGAGLTNWLVG